LSQIQFGWVLPIHSKTGNVKQSATFLAELGGMLDLITGHFDSAWCADHLQFGNMHILEGWTTLTYFAALYPLLAFGNMVLCQSFRNPALIAKMAATFQYISNGRLIFGIGAGWYEEEYKAYGYKFPSPGTRVDELEETLLIVKSLWSNEQATLQGVHYQVVNARCEPKPLPPPPIVIGGSKPRILRVIARYADWWSADEPNIADYREQIIECERACTEVKRNPASLRRTWSGNCVCLPTEASLKLLKRDYKGFIGTPSQIIEQMRPFIDFGVDYFMLQTGEFSSREMLELLINEVLPGLNR
jgi:alkanesulfonate monooxygenase SsuD/methylene tetrahydromethanopterin reductase-like flavin-dependent oxidoreductase (luciferase family)